MMKVELQQIQVWNKNIQVCLFVCWILIHIDPVKIIWRLSSYTGGERSHAGALSVLYQALAGP
jgi:hypothetical protein